MPADSTAPVSEHGITGTPGIPLPGPTPLVQGPAFSRDGHLLASSGADRAVRLWNLGSGHLKAVLLWNVGSGHLKAVLLWNVGSGHLKAVLRGHTDVVDSLAPAPDGQTLISASDDATARSREPECAGRPAPRLCAGGPPEPSAVEATDHRAIPARLQLTPGWPQRKAQGPTSGLDDPGPWAQQQR
ncbi:WD40 repeat domain-containing protein [Streptomyces sp. NPDC001262]|uniref:WD40 repeat domain-containing protein n=1 Tax=Streptomyces sp. NPDC001262 TaxID=3364552 RepID=UPI0036AD2A51